MKTRKIELPSDVVAKLEQRGVSVTPDFLDRLDNLLRKPRLPRNPKTRLTRALELREPALKIFQKHAKWIDAGGVRIQEASHAGFQIEYKTPFHKYFRPSDLVIARAAAAGFRYDRLPYGLYIYGPHGSKPCCCVMAFEWDDTGRTRLITFRSGEWEQQLRDAA